MKIRTTILAFTAALALSLSCEHIQERADVQSWTGNCVSLAVGPATKTVLNGLMPVWSAGDVLTVYDQDGVPVEFTNSTGAGTTATFSTTSWTGKVPVCAIYGENAAYNLISGVVGVNIPTSQTAPAGSFALSASPSIGAVSSSDGNYSVSTMKNVASLLSFSFSTENEIVSLLIEGANGEQIAGSVNVNYPSMSWSAGSNPAASIFLAAEGGTFLSGVPYYAAILPGVFNNGLRFTITDSDGNVRIKEVGKELGMEFIRGRICSFEEVDAEPVIPAPEEFVVSLDFKSGWPFSKVCAATADQDADGETYTYEYSSNLNLAFKLIKPESGSYTYTSNHISYDLAGGKIVLPKVKDRYLNSVVVVHEMNGAKSFELHKVSDNTKLGVTHTTSEWKCHVPVAKFSPHEDERCYISLLSEGTAITNVYLYYTSSATGSDAVQLGFQFNYNTFNQNTNGDTYTNNGTSSPFFGINTRQKDRTEVFDTYSFTQTVNGLSYTFTSLRPTSEYTKGDLYCWSGGLWSGQYGNEKYLKLPRTGKLVWVRAAVANATNGSNGRYVRIDAKEPGATGYDTVGNGVYLGATAYGLGDGSSASDNAEYKIWCLDDSYSPTKEYYLYCSNGYTWLDELVLIYL